MVDMKQLLESTDYVMLEQQRQWTEGEIPVMTATITAPQFGQGAKNRISRRLDRYYRQCTRSFLSYCNRYLYPQALIEFKSACQAGAPLPHAHANLQFTVACNQEHVFSLYADCTEWAGTRNALTLRRADTWDLTTGAPISARECFPKGARVRRLCLKAAREHCARQSAAGLSVYADDLSLRLRRHLNLRNFYLSEEGFHFFYQPYAIAPAVEGCPTFFLPFSSETGPFWPVNHGFPCKTEKAIV